MATSTPPVPNTTVWQQMHVVDHRLLKRARETDVGDERVDTGIGPQDHNAGGLVPGWMLGWSQKMDRLRSRELRG